MGAASRLLLKFSNMFESNDVTTIYNKLGIGSSEGVADLRKDYGLGPSIVQVMARFKIATLTDLSEDTLTKVEVEGKAIVIGLVDGKPFAMEGRCSHMGQDLSKGKKEGYLVRCKMHGAEFDIRTGDVLRNLQAKKLQTYPLTLEGEEVFIEL